jgi:hypothetical protein
VAQTREAILRLTARHADKAALQLLASEVASAGTSWAPGTTGIGGRPSVSPLIRQYAFLLDKSKLKPAVVLNGTAISIPEDPSGRDVASRVAAKPAAQAVVEPAALAASETVEVPLIQVAWARSGDKGDISNIGVIARKPDWLPVLRQQLSEARVAEHLSHLIAGKVTRYELPGIAAFNFVCEQALAGGGMASLRNDSLGKGMGQILLALPVKVPKAWFAKAS